MCRHQNMERGLEGGSTHVSNGGREILPGNVVPRHYDLTLEPNFETFKFEGRVVVDLDVVEDTSSISFNALEIDIHSATVLSGSHTIS